MFVEPKIDEVVNGERGMLTGIRVCLDAQCLVSAVTLMFSSIDALAALTRPVGQRSTNGVVFKDWIEKYLDSKTTLNCTSEDLWGARCGVLHLYSAESDQSAQNKARRIFYQWKAGPAADTKRAIPVDALIIEVEALKAAVDQAIHRFIVASEMEPEVKKRVQSHLPSMLCYEPYPIQAMGQVL